ncbi:unnamed protein product [Rodentolepis nana]|uniref:Regulator of microtubule dynamics protein 1 n=1 Tax=Rodentolepis nana TaxID=102285 RepID=A0A0R3T7D6_RODNA|nr:unnamed protein product [Rodentolepis nana]
MSESYLKKLDELYQLDKHQEIYDQLRKEDGDYSSLPPELIWRLGRAIRYLVFTKGKDDKQLRKQWLDEGLSLMKMAVEKYPNDSQCNTWYGILLSLESLKLGPKRRIELAYVIREYFDKAYEEDSKNFVLLHCLGTWCFEVAHYSKIEREMSAMFFSRPPESSYDEALRYYLESYQVNPNLLFTSARIAQCYDKLKNKEAAKKWAEKALSRPGKDEEALVKAYEIDSQYFVLLHCLGAWCFEFANLNRFERELAGVFFKKPPDSSFDEALRYYLESYRVNPKLIYTIARIAQCYDRLKDKEAAKKWAEKALSEPGKDDEALEV